MIGRFRAMHLGGVSTVAAGMAAFFPMEARADCAATTAAAPNGVVVTCTAGPAQTQAFATRYTTTVVPGYNGNNPDTITITGGEILNSGADTPQVGTTGVFLDASLEVMQTLGGGDVVTISNGTIGAAGDTVSIDLGDGADTFSMSGGTMNGSVFGGLGVDSIEISGTAAITGVAGVSAAIETGDGNNEVRIRGGTIGTDPNDLAVLLDGAGANIFDMSGGTVNGNIVGQGGGNSYTASGGRIDGSLFSGSGNDAVTISGNVVINAGPVQDDAIGLQTGDDQLTMTGGTIIGNVSGNEGDDAFIVSGGTIQGILDGNDGADSMTISGGTVDNVAGGAGNDLIHISGGTVTGNVSGDAGNDNVNVSGGTIAGNVMAEEVILSGGTIGGNISGISSHTLVIDDSLSPVPLDLPNGVVFTGSGNANAFMSNTDLAQGGTEFQVFTGFGSLQADASTLGFGTGTIGIGTLTLMNGSTLFINGSVNLPGNASITNSTIQMIDGAAGDVLTLGGITLNGATIGLDINQQSLQADQIIAAAFSAAGTNTILVNLLGTPQFAQTTDIPIIVTDDPIDGNFAISGVPGTPGALFTYELFLGPDGSLFIRAIPTGTQFALAPQNTIDVATVDTALDALYGINNDAIAYDLGLANGVRAAKLTPTLSVFASGQLAHMEHDGFDISSGGLTGVGPSFDVDEFSAAISLDFNAAKAFELDQQYGLNLGLFGGYASADLDAGSFLTFDHSGDATNRSGMFGAYGLFRQGFSYALVSTLAFIGETDITNDILGTTGDYGTEGYAVTGSVGHIFVLGEKLRFDLRGGLLGVSFTGADYVDSGGNRYGESRISFGAIKLEPGIYADFPLENGMIISPYARTELQQRFGYSNKATLDDVEVNFEDADFSAALYGGFNLKMTERSTLSTEIRGKWSSDSTTVAGKLGLKISF